MKSKIYLVELGRKLFFTGLFFLPSALPISGLLFLFSIILSTFSSYKDILKDNFNRAVLICIGLIFFSSINNLYLNIPEGIKEAAPSNIIGNLANWIITLVSFITFQTYLKKTKDRIIFAKVLIAGIFPFLISCFIQLWTDDIGPFEFLNGLIIWFQKPLEVTGGISGLFSNRNYAGFWLAINIPFAFFLIEENKSNLIKKIYIYLITIFLIIFVFLTNSRNALISLLSSVIIYHGLKFFLFILIFLAIILFLTNLFPSFTNSIFLVDYFSASIERIANFSFFKNAPRLIIWRSAIDFISQRPLLGWGAGTFTILYTNKKNFWSPPLIYFEPQHSHNLALELGINFGIPITIFILILAFKIFIEASIRTFKQHTKVDFNNLDKAWIASSFVVIISQLNDLTYYDGKINLIITILFSGLKCMTLKK